MISLIGHIFIVWAGFIGSSPYDHHYKILEKHFDMFTSVGIDAYHRHHHL